jgi:uncharacterized membrane protein
MWQKLGRYYPVRLELVPLALVVFTWYLTVSNYPSLPAQVPVHFGTDGTPDGWGGRAAIFLYPVLGTAMFLMFSGINLLFSVVKDPKNLINLPKDRLQKLTPEAAGHLIKTISRGLFALKVILEAMFLNFAYSTVTFASGKTSGLGWFFWLIIGSVVLVAAYMIYHSFRLTLSPKNRLPFS